MNPLQSVPDGAVIQFNGNDLSNWRSREGGSADWTVKDGVMTVVPGAGDIATLARFTDFQMHLEFRLPDMAEATGQAKANSGVYLQGRYEIQVLDSFGFNIPGKGDCGAIYDQVAPLVNANRRPMEWQTYDVVFRAPRVDAKGEMVEHARVSLTFNGQVIQNNTQLTGPTGGAIDHDLGMAGPLLLQDHGHLISYRNIWVVELPLEGSGTYEPR